MKDATFVSAQYIYPLAQRLDSARCRRLQRRRVARHPPPEHGRAGRGLVHARNKHHERAVHRDSPLPGDFNRDGTPDIVLQRSDGAVGVWLMDGTTITAGQYIESNSIPGWTVKGTGDFNNDLNTDILFQYQDGRAGVWFMNGTSVTSAQYIYNQPTQWTLAYSK
jgi:hypothetical protein